LKEALKKKQEMENHLANITWILKFINTQETHFMRDYCFFKIKYDGRNAGKMETQYCRAYVHERWQTKGGKV
jgi:hypothetical protein